MSHYALLPLQLGGVVPALVGLLVLFLAVVIVWQMVKIVDAYEKTTATAAVGNRAAV